MRDEKDTGVKFSDKEVSDFECDVCTLIKYIDNPSIINPTPDRLSSAKLHTGIPAVPYFSK
jgi:hypothetical protein